MIIYPNSKHTPLLLCNLGKELDVYSTTYRITRQPLDKMFNEDSLQQYHHIDEIIKLVTPIAGDYIFDKYSLIDFTCNNILVIACKINDDRLRINPDIPDKSEWVVFRNSDSTDRLIPRFIKNHLQVDKRQVIKVTNREMIDMFSGLKVTMGMHNESYQKEISRNFLSAYRELIAV